MEKQEIINTIRTALHHSAVHHKDIEDLIREHKNEPYISKKTIFYILAAIFIILGARGLIGEIWIALGKVGHILATLGLGLVISISTYLVLQTGKVLRFASLFHIVAGILISSGVYLLLDYLSTGSKNYLVPGVIFAVLAVITAYFSQKNKSWGYSALVFNSIIFATTAVVNTFLYFTDTFTEIDIFFLGIVVGVAYILIGRSQKDIAHRHLITILNSMSYITIYSSFAVMLLDPPIFSAVVWEGLLYAAIMFGFYMAYRLPTGAGIIFSSLAIISTIFYTAQEHFSGTPGYVLFILIGVLFLIFGYFSIKFFKENG